MSLEPLQGFRHFPTHHCVTGSMRHVYVHNGHDISEEMLLGIGAGVSFSYWHFKGQPPFMGGRGAQATPGRDYRPAHRGKITSQATTSARKAGKTLLEMLDAGQPVMLQCDMGFLPYFDFGGEEYHFGGHVVVVCGYDPASDQVLVADRDEDLHPVSMEDLERARGSTYKPFPPKNRWYTFDFDEKRQPTAGEVRQAIWNRPSRCWSPPSAIWASRASARQPRWCPSGRSSWSPDELRFALFNAYVFISPVGGTGGGAFRYMFSRFLREAADILATRAWQRALPNSSRSATGGKAGCLVPRDLGGARPGSLDGRLRGPAQRPGQLGGGELAAAARNGLAALIACGYALGKRQTLPYKPATALRKDCQTSPPGNVPRTQGVIQYLHEFRHVN